MLDIGSTELLMIVIVAVVVIGPKDLPRALYRLGQLVGKARSITRHFRAGIDAMVREAELEELEKKWAADNARIMREHAAIGNAMAAPLMEPLPANPPPSPEPSPEPAPNATAESDPDAAPRGPGEPAP